jgi:hypothetical protein
VVAEAIHNIEARQTAAKNIATAAKKQATPLKTAITTNLATQIRAMVEAINYNRKEVSSAPTATEKATTPKTAAQTPTKTKTNHKSSSIRFLNFRRYRSTTASPSKSTAHASSVIKQAIVHANAQHETISSLFNQ